MSFFSLMNQSQPKKNHRSGFTLIELLVAATIVIVLTTIGLVSYRSALNKSKDGKRKSDLETLRQALVLYKADYGRYPTTSDPVATLKSGGYLSKDSSTDAMKDPDSPASSYVYTYGALGVSFTITATLEDGSTYTVASP